jgi:hypothetical protein
MSDYSVADEHKISQENIDYYFKHLKKLESGPGGIMEMKQTISNKEAEIARLQKYRDLVHYIANDYHELSYEKAQWQRDDWKKRCMKLRNELENDDEQA